jgi:TMEM175 potassium channel family protein
VAIPERAQQEHIRGESGQRSGPAEPVGTPDDAAIHPGQMRTSRLEAFSDGVFAIAITLLVLEISVPEHSGTHLLEAIRDEWPSYLAYIVSFSTIGVIWLEHHTITDYLERVTSVFIRLNLLLLLVVAFVPFPTRILAEYLHERDAERIAVTFYGLTLLAANIVLSVLWRYAVRDALVKPDAHDEEVSLLTQRLTPGLGGYVSVIVLGIFFPTAAVVGFLVMALFFLIPYRPRRAPTR